MSSAAKETMTNYELKEMGREKCVKVSGNKTQLMRSWWLSGRQSCMSAFELAIDSSLQGYISITQHLGNLTGSVRHVNTHTMCCQRM